MGGPITEIMREANAFVGRELMGQVAPPQAGPSTAPAAPQLTAAQQSEINSFFSLNQRTLAAFLRTTGLTRLGPNPTEAQREKAIRDLFEAIRIGGGANIAYECGTGRDPRTPEQVLSSRRGDCDELCRLFIALARELNIPLTGVSMGTMRFNTSAPGTNAPEPHAALFISGLGGRNYVFDPVFRRIDAVPDFSIQSLSGIYVGLRIGPGRAAANFPIRSIASTNPLSALADIAAHHYIDAANYYGARVFNNTTNTKAQDMASAFSALSRVGRLSPGNPVLCVDAFSIADSLGDTALTDKRYALARDLFTIALSALANAPASVRATKRAEEYDARMGLAMSHEMRGRHADAFAGYSALMSLDPANPNAYLRAFNLAITLGNRPRIPAADVRRYATQAYIIARDAAGKLPAGSNQADFQRRLNELTALFQRRGWPTP